MKKLLIASLCFGTLLMTACKKDKQKTTQEKVQGKWKLISIEVKDYSNNNSQITKYTGTERDYIDIRSDGKMYSFLDNQNDTSGYKVLNDQYLLIEGLDSTKITNLTDSELTLYNKSIDGANYTEQTISLKK